MIEQRLNVVSSEGPIPSPAMNDSINLHNQLETFKNQIKNILFTRMNVFELRLNIVASNSICNDYRGKTLSAHEESTAQSSSSNILSSPNKSICYSRSSKR
jgi:hypothetical protein